VAISHVIRHGSRTRSALLFRRDYVITTWKFVLNFMSGEAEDETSVICSRVENQTEKTVSDFDSLIYIIPAIVT
jgi:hypothetical protein